MFAASSGLMIVASSAGSCVFSGCRWCDCPPECGLPTTIYNRFVRWARRGPWEDLFRELARCGRSADTQMIDSAHVKSAPRGIWWKGGKTKLWAVRAEGATQRFMHPADAKGPKQRSAL
jgi:transposase